MCRYTPSGSVSDSSELTTGYFSLLLLAMFAVVSGYSVSEKVLLLWERYLLADREVRVDCLDIDCRLTCELQRHSESIAVISRSQQHDGVIKLALLFFVK